MIIHLPNKPYISSCQTWSRKVDEGESAQDPLHIEIE